MTKAEESLLAFLDDEIARLETLRLDATKTLMRSMHPEWNDAQVDLGAAIMVEKLDIAAGRKPEGMLH